jgi:phosphate transporter
VLAAWVLLIYIIKPDDVKTIPIIVYESKESGISNIKKCVILSITVLCIIGFATSSWTNNIFGDVSIISILYMAIMFGTGLLTEIDFNSLSWHTLVLVGGGNILGKCIESSGLLSFIANGIIKGIKFLIILIIYL